MKHKPPFWATVFMLCSVAVLCGLGTWQIQRLQWKQDILQKLETAYESGADQTLGPDALEEQDFSFGRTQGVFLPGKAFLTGPRTHDSRVGNDLIMPLKTGRGTLLVNLGWTDQSLNDLPLKNLKKQTVRLEGLARRPDWNIFTPENQPQNDQWYRLDIGEIATTKNLDAPWPFILYAERMQPPALPEFPNTKRWNPPNNHLGYALFWFTMAGVLVAVYVLRFIGEKKK